MGWCLMLDELTSVTLLAESRNAVGLEHLATWT